MNLYQIAFPTRNKFEGVSTYIYSSKLKLNLGDLVRCPFGKKSLSGLIIADKVEPPKFKFKEIEEVVLEHFLTDKNVALFNWISDYYCSDPGVTLELFCTNNLISRIINKTDSKWLEKEIEKISKVKSKPIKLNKLNKQQLSAFKEVSSGDKSFFILHGATGSGKTEVYLHLAQESIKEKKSVLILVPEIGLTTQNIARFEELGVPLITLHSGQTPVARAKSWQLIDNLTKESKPIIILGPRSAMFSPIHNLGLTVIDEFHDQSYKQDSAPKYNSVIVGGMLAKLNNSKLIPWVL